MESACQDKKFQSSWELPSSTSLDPERKDSPVNPYHRSATMTSPKWALPNANDNESDVVSGLPEFECDVLASACRPPEIRDSSDETSAVRLRNEDKERKEAHWKIKAKVENAVKRHKIFLIRGELPRLKEALEARGWVHKYEPTRTRMLPYGTAANLEAHSLGDITQADGTLNEKAVIFALLRHRQPDFIWDCRNDFVEWQRGIRSDVILNKYQRSFVYTSKLGMARSLADAYWLHEENVSSVLYPRSYSPSTDRRAFLEDFRLTAAASLLKWFVRGMNAAEEILVSDTKGQCAIPIARLEFALERCQRFISDATHEDLDEEGGVQWPSDEEWELFLDDYTAALHHGAGIECSSEDNSERLQRCFLNAVVTLEKLKTVDPQYNVNGMRGIWILKPSHLCCGNGIVISHDLKDILRRVEEKPRDYYIIQKYIECPLLIKETKFDIRLWYLVTSTFPLTIWLFKEALLRFSSKPYTFSTYHEAIHVCNTAVQEKYSEYERRRRLRRAHDSPEKSAGSVRDQGWDCEKLNEYLKSEGHMGEPYYDQIYPKMAEAIVLTMLAAQDCMERRRCSFELYGADFMVAEDMSVWLIEINTNPRMHPPSSKITKRLYANVLESLVKEIANIDDRSLRLDELHIAQIRDVSLTRLAWVITAAIIRGDVTPISATCPYVMDLLIMDVPVDVHADTEGFDLVYKQNIADFQPYLGPCLFVAGKSMTLHQPQPVERTSEKEKRANICGPRSTQQRARTEPPVILRSRRSNVVDLIDYFSTVRCTATN